MTDRDAPPGDPPAPGLSARSRRRLRALGAGVAAASSLLAGCSTGAEPSASAPDDGGSEGEDAAGGGATLGGDCNEARVQELYDELDRLSMAEGELRMNVDETRTNVAALETLADQLENGFDAATERAARDVGRRIRESVVLLEGAFADGDVHGEGTGWVADDGRVLTNAHVVADRARGPVDEVTIRTLDGDAYAGTVAGHVEEHTPDVALVAADADVGPPLPFGSLAALEPGDPLVQVGHPGEVGNWVISLGRLVAAEEAMTMERAYTELRTTVPGREGVSGSPVVTLEGDVVGITWGSGPPVQRRPGERPPVAPDAVFDAPIAMVGVSQHAGLDAVRELYEEWTA